MKNRIALLAVVFMWLAGTGYTISLQYAVNGVPFDMDGLTHYVAPGTVTIDLTCTAVNQLPIYDGELICLKRDASLTGTYYNPANLPVQGWFEDLGWMAADDFARMTDSDGELVEGRFLYLWGYNGYFPEMSEGNLWTFTFQMPLQSKAIFFNFDIQERFAIVAIPEPATVILMLLGTGWLAGRRKG